MSDMQPQGSYKSAAELDELYESTDLNIKEVLGYALVLVVLCVVTCFGIKLLMDYYSAQSIRNREVKSLRFVADAPLAGPLLQADPGKETQALTATAMSRLNGYGWVDRDAQIAHIPIDRAIDILAASGLPRRGKVDRFHPRPGSTGTEKVGVPTESAQPVEPAQPAEPASEAPSGTEPKP